MMIITTTNTNTEKKPEKKVVTVNILQALVAFVIFFITLCTASDYKVAQEKHFCFKWTQSQ